MNPEYAFRTLFILSFIAMLGIRIYFQLRARRARGKVEIREKSPSLISGSIAALVAVIFGAEYIISPGTVSFAYILSYPVAIRWLGAILLIFGILLVGSYAR